MGAATKAQSLMKGEALLVYRLSARQSSALKALLLALSTADRYARFCRTASDDTICAYVRSIDRDEWVAFGAFDAEARLIGVSELFDTGTQSCEIALAVAAERRGCGIGRALMNRALKAAHARGRRVLLTCLADNHAMHRLARTTGFTPHPHAMSRDDEHACNGATATLDRHARIVYASTPASCSSNSKALRVDTACVGTDRHRDDLEL
jgi:GNAT superfamily N-acetyltransferase